MIDILTGVLVIIACYLLVCLFGIVVALFSLAIAVVMTIFYEMKSWLKRNTKKE